MNHIFVEQNPPMTVEEVIDFCRNGPTLRKLKEMVDRTSLSADMKALLIDVAGITVKVGNAIVAIGRSIVSIALWLSENTPFTALGVALALVLTTIIGAVPLIGGVLVLALNKLLLLAGLTLGAIHDIRQNAMKSALDRVAEQFAALNEGARA